MNKPNEYGFLNALGMVLIIPIFLVIDKIGGLYERVCK